MIALYVSVDSKWQNFKGNISLLFFFCIFIKQYEKILVHNFYWLKQNNNFSTTINSKLINTAITRKMFLFALASFTSGPMNTNLKNTSSLFCCEIKFFCSEFYFQNGCSVRLLNPQTYSRNVWKLLSVLQEYFNCCVGANV